MPTSRKPAPVRTPATVTQLLIAWQDGDRAALSDLMERVHPELRRIAARHMSSERGDHSLQPTALVNEAYLRLVDDRREWRDRTHFFAVASTIMRRVLVDHARTRRAEKRQGVKVLVLEGDGAIKPARVDVLDLDAALIELATIDPLESQVVDLRFFGGLTIDEAAQFLGVGHATVERGWRLARAWLFRRLTRA